MSLEKTLLDVKIKWVGKRSGGFFLRVLLTLPKLEQPIRKRFLKGLLLNYFNSKHAPSILTVLSVIRGAILSIFTAQTEIPFLIFVFQLFFSKLHKNSKLGIHYVSILMLKNI